MFYISISNTFIITCICFQNAEMAQRKERVRVPTINMFYYTYISYDDYTILIHSFNCPAIKQGIFIFLSSSSHHRYIILLLLDIVIYISLNHAICYIRKNIGSPLLAWIIYFRVLFPYFLNLWQTINRLLYTEDTSSNCCCSNITMFYKYDKP